jgi:serine/threonine protein kinase
MASTHYDEKDDMWALGCIVYELLTGQRIGKAEVLPPSGLIPLGMQLEFDLTNGTRPTVVTKLLQPLQVDLEGREQAVLPGTVGRDEEVDWVRLLARLLAYKPTERPAAKEAGQVARGERGEEVDEDAVKRAVAQARKEMAEELSKKNTEIAAMQQQLQYMKLAKAKEAEEQAKQQAKQQDLQHTGMVAALGGVTMAEAQKGEVIQVSEMSTQRQFKF